MPVKLLPLASGIRKPPCQRGQIAWYSMHPPATTCTWAAGAGAAGAGAADDAAGTARAATDAREIAPRENRSLRMASLQIRPRSR